MINQKIYNFSHSSLKDKVFLKIKKNLKSNKKTLNIFKKAVPELVPVLTFERTYLTCLGYTLQEIASKFGKNVINADKGKTKICGVDLLVSYLGEVSLKLNKNTQCGTHQKDSFKKLVKNAKNPVMAVAFSESYEYKKNNVLYLGGEAFWSKIDIDYQDLYDTIQKSIQDTYDEIKLTYGSTLQ
tara:strand:- start:692 stop:1243 length:552 start_codon:yes stop_codon:yes gene_type:complete